MADTAQERLQRLLQGLDQNQLEGLVLSLHCPELVQPQPAALRWASLRGSGAAELASLLPELWPGRAWEEVLGRVFRHLGLPFPQEEVREAMSGEQARCRVGESAVQMGRPMLSLTAQGLRQQQERALNTDSKAISEGRVRSEPFSS